MDPTACLQEILDAAEANDKDTYVTYCTALANWLDKGGFKPKLDELRTPIQRVPAYGMPYSIESPALGSAYETWTLVEWDQQDNRRAAWSLEA